MSSRLEMTQLLHDYVNRLTAAATAIQKAGFCCNQFTILTEAHEESTQSLGGRLIRMNTVLFRDLDRLHITITDIRADILSIERVSGKTDAITSIDDVMSILSSTENWSRLKSLTIDGQLHVCSLAIQLLSMGLLLYSQAYTGHLHPFFLTTPLTEVLLRGISTHGDMPYIVVERQQLACLGDMVGDGVFVFRLVPDQNTQTWDPTMGRRYLRATCEQVADLWGPAYTVSNTSTASPFHLATLTGLYIRGGLIRPDPRSTRKDPMFHWGQQEEEQPNEAETFSYWEEIVIGTITECQPAATEQTESSEKTTLLGLRSRSPPAGTASILSPYQGTRPFVTINTTCPLVSVEIRRESEPYLARLGTSPDWWSLTEIQGMAAMNPPYVTLQGAFSVTKQSGIPLKRVLLDRWIGDDTFSLFDEPWGVQVSLCTGVARRVPLRFLIEEPLIQYINTLSIPGWEALKSSAIPAIQAEHEFHRWARNLNAAERQCMRMVFTKLLQVLRDTGFGQSRKCFSILWPHATDARFCVQIRPEKDKNQLWCAMLQDSECCASFAVVSSQCLETRNHPCRKGLTTQWQGGSMLATVVCHNLTGAIPRPIAASTGAVFYRSGLRSEWTLQPNKPYWVGKQGSQIWVVVRKEDGVVTELQVRRNRFPTSAFLWPDRVLREKPDIAFRGEEVFVLHR